MYITYLESHLMVILFDTASCLPIAHVRARWLYWNAFSEVFHHRHRGAINFVRTATNYLRRAMAARFAGRFLESVACEGSVPSPGINLNYKFHRTMARAKGGPTAVNASGRGGDCARWSSVERINLIYLSFIRPSVAPPSVRRND